MERKELINQLYYIWLEEDTRDDSKELRDSLDNAAAIENKIREAGYKKIAFELDEIFGDVCTLSMRDGFHAGFDIACKLIAGKEEIA